MVYHYCVTMQNYTHDIFEAYLLTQKAKVPYKMC